MACFLDWKTILSKLSVSGCNYSRVIWYVLWELVLCKHGEQFVGTYIGLIYTNIQIFESKTSQATASKLKCKLHSMCCSRDTIKVWQLIQSLPPPPFSCYVKASYWVQRLPNYKNKATILQTMSDCYCLGIVLFVVSSVMHKQGGV